MSPWFPFHVRSVGNELLCKYASYAVRQQTMITAQTFMRASPEICTAGGKNKTIEPFNSPANRLFALLVVMGNFDELLFNEA